MKYFWAACLGLCLHGFSLTYAQTNPEAELAEQYLLDGELESALELFLKLDKKSPSENFVLKILDIYGQMDQNKEALKYIDKSIRQDKDNLLFLAVKADLLSTMGETKDADKLYNELIGKKLRIEGDFARIGVHWYQNGQFDKALETYQQGRKRLKNTYVFSDEIANIYVQQGEVAEATQEYLNAYLQNSSNESSAKMSILNLVNPQTSEEVEQALLEVLEKHESDEGLRVIVYEYYVLAENFFEAFIQVKSIDRLYREEGARVFAFGETMRNNQRYDLSNKAYDYIIERKRNSPFFYRAHMEKAINNELKAFDQISVDMEAVTAAVAAYDDLLSSFGREPQYFDAIYRKARLLVFYLFKLDEAQQELETISQRLNRTNARQREQLAQAQLLRGDIYVMQKEYGKGELAYKQVAELFENRQIGALAKFKQAQLSYYKGEFQLAQALLGAIKDNTSNDISNDAIRLNLLIIDNTGLDTSTVALAQFAQAQLMVYQREFDKALTQMDSLAYKFPNHSLADEMLWEKANIFLKKNDHEQALGYIDRILKDFSLDIYGDDALFTKARIYDYTLKDPELALKYYLELLATFPGSLYSVDVRKRVRELRKVP